MPPDTFRALTADELAGELGVSRASVYRWAQTGAIPTLGGEERGEVTRFDPEHVRFVLERRHGDFVGRAAQGARVHDGQTGGPASFGEAVVRSDGYWRLREALLAGRAPNLEERSFPVAQGEGLAGMIRRRTYSDLTSFSIDPVTGIRGLLPAAAMVPALLDVVTTDKAQLELAPQTGQTLVDPAGFVVPVGTTLLEPAITWPTSPTLQQLARCGMGWPVSSHILADPGPAQRYLDNAFSNWFMVALESEVLNAPGTGGYRWTGITQAAGVGAITKGDTGHASEYEIDAIVRGAQAVLGAGWVGYPLSIVASPTTIVNILLQKDTGGRYLELPDELKAAFDMASWVPSNAMATGKAVVGAFNAGGILFVKGSGAEVDFSAEQADYFTRGLVAMKVEARAWFTVAEPSAFAIVSNL